MKNVGKKTRTEESQRVEFASYLERFGFNYNEFVLRAGEMFARKFLRYVLTSNMIGDEIVEIAREGRPSDYVVGYLADLELAREDISTEVLSVLPDSFHRLSSVVCDYVSGRQREFEEKSFDLLIASGKPQRDRILA